MSLIVSGIGVWFAMHRDRNFVLEHLFCVWDKQMSGLVALTFALRACTERCRRNPSCWWWSSPSRARLRTCPRHSRSATQCSLAVVGCGFLWLESVSIDHWHRGPWEFQSTMVYCMIWNRDEAPVTPPWRMLVLTESRKYLILGTCGIQAHLDQRSLKKQRDIWQTFWLPCPGKVAVGNGPSWNRCKHRWKDGWESNNYGNNVVCWGKYWQSTYWHCQYLKLHD